MNYIFVHNEYEDEECEIKEYIIVNDHPDEGFNGRYELEPYLYYNEKSYINEAATTQTEKAYLVSFKDDGIEGYCFSE